MSHVADSSYLYSIRNPNCISLENDFKTGFIQRVFIFYNIKKI